MVAFDSTCPLRTLGSVASLLAATLYQDNPDRNQALEYHINWELCTSYAGAAGMLLHVHGGK